MGGRRGLGLVSGHRIRLDDSDLELIVASLRARLAMTGGARRAQMERLITRLQDVAPGNPAWRLGGTGGYGGDGFGTKAREGYTRRISPTAETSAPVGALYGPLARL